MNARNIPVKDLREYENNPRRISERAVNAVAASIREFGFRIPVLIDSNNVIICGHTRLKAAEQLGLKEVPCIIADDLTPEQIKAFRLVDNKTAELSGWDFEKLEIELEVLDFDFSEFGFDSPEDVDINSFFESSPEKEKDTEEKYITCPECGAHIKL